LVYSDEWKLADYRLIQSVYAKGRVGVAAEVLETGASVSLNPQEHFPMQSVYKLPIGMAVLAQVDNREGLGNKVSQINSTQNATI